MIERNLRPGLFSRVISSLGNLTSRISINDPTTPSLSMDLPLPTMGSLKYSVRDFSESPRNSQESRALNCHVTLGNCINAVQSMMERPLDRWSAVNLLQIVPTAGPDMNAYYDRRSLKFFYHNHKGKTVYFGDSVDIVAHELGHAVLDAMRPDFWSVQSLEIWSFHEAFSDVVSVFNLLNYDVAIRQVIEETNGDLRLPNHSSRLAEEVGRLIRDYTGDPAYLPDALRDPARERFHYVDPRSLPDKTRNDHLAAECHSFGRVFSAAWYEALVRLYEQSQSMGVSPEESLARSRDVCFSVILKGAQASPRVVDYYEAVARCMVAVAADHGPDVSSIFSDVFREWKIIRPEGLRPMSTTSRREVLGRLKKGDSVVRTRSGSIITIKNNSLVDSKDLPIIGGLSLPRGLSIEVPQDVYYEMDANGEVMLEVRPDRDRILDDAAKCMVQVHDELDAGGMWEFKDGKVSRRLVR